MYSDSANRGKTFVYAFSHMVVDFVSTCIQYKCATMHYGSWGHGNSHGMDGYI